MSFKYMNDNYLIDDMNRESMSLLREKSYESLVNDYVVKKENNVDFMKIFIRFMKKSIKSMDFQAP